MNYSLLDEATKKYPAHADAISDLKINLYMENAEMNDEELKERIQSVVKVSNNARVRESKQLAPYRDPDVTRHTQRSSFNQTGSSFGSKKAGELSKVFPSPSNQTGDLIQAIRSEAVNSLPTHKRQLLEEYFLNGKTAKELIGRFGDTEEAVRQGAKRAKDDLRVLLGK